MSSEVVQEGVLAPDFSLASGEQESVILSALRGQPVVVYFYPKDSTPGCTTEACDFRDNMARLQAYGAVVLGISPDSVASHLRFAEKQSLNFPLLSDPGAEVAQQWGVWQLKKNYGREYMGIVRSTFLLDSAGVVRRVWTNVRVKGHVDAVLEALGQLS